MPLSNGPNLGVLVNGALGEEHYDELMAQWRALDTLIQCNVISMVLTAPPATPADGDTYIVAASPTGAWVGKATNLARWSAVLGAWEFFAPKEGWKAYCLADDLDHKFNGTAWVVASGGGSGIVESIVAGSGISVNNADPANPVVSATGGGGGGSTTTAIPIAVSDETTALTTGTAKVTFRMPFAFTLTGVRASVTTAPTGSVLTVDINEGGASILSTKLTIDAGEKTSTTAATAPVISDTALADDAEFTIDIDTVGSTVAGAGLKVYLIGTVG